MAERGLITWLPARLARVSCLVVCLACVPDTLFGQLAQPAQYVTQAEVNPGCV